MAVFRYQRPPLSPRQAFSHLKLAVLPSAPAHTRWLPDGVGIGQGRPVWSVIYRLASITSRPRRTGQLGTFESA